MQQNKFEKDVQQELSGLRLKPSSEVWLKVEEQIKEKRKRRLVLVILLPLLLAGTGSVFYFSNHSKSSIAVKQALPATVSQNEKPTELSEKYNTENGVDKISSPAPSLVKKDGDQQISEYTIPGINKGKPLVRVENKGEKKIAHGRDIETGIGFSKAKTKEEIVADLNETEFLLTDSGLLVAEQSGVGQLVRNNTAAIPLTSNEEESKNDVFSSLLSKQNPTVEEPVIAAINDPESRKRKPEWGLTVKSGLFKLKEASRFFKSSAADAYSSPAGGGGQQNSGGSASQPSPIRSGISYAIGAQVKIPVGKRNYFVSSLGMSLYQTKTSTGSFVDSSGYVYSLNSSRVEGYYRTGSVSAFTSKYYFAELGAAMQWRINRSEKFPICLQTGLTYSRHISSKGLYYAKGSNIYINDRGIVNPNQLMGEIGIAVPIFKESKHPMQLGAFLQYGITGHYYNYVPENLHGRYMGLKLSVTF